MADKNYRAELVGVFGDPVDGNPTCVVEEAAFREAGLNWRYLTCRVSVEDLPAAIAGMKAIGMRGVNLTMPHKIAVIPMLDELSQAARVIGAVNTVYLREGKWIGENTDGKGFVRSLTDASASPEDKVVTLLGAGGAAKAIGVECALAGAKRIYIFNRNRERGEALAETIRKNTAAEAEYFPWNGSVKIPKDSDILINATCVGLFPDVDACPDVDFETLKPGTVVSDVVFNPVRTVFLCRAEAKGAKILTGTGMLVNQAAENFRLWTGETASRETMMNALVKEFGEA